MRSQLACLALGFLLGALYKSDGHSCARCSAPKGHRGRYKSVLRPYAPKPVFTGTIGDEASIPAFKRVAAYTRGFASGELRLRTPAEFAAQTAQAEAMAKLRGGQPHTGTGPNVGVALLRNLFLYDEQRYGTWAPTVQTPSSQVSLTTAEALVRRWQHDIEKGLSMRDMRLHFGITSGIIKRLHTAGQLVASLSSQLKRPEDSVALSAIVSALRAYAAIHKERGQIPHHSVTDILKYWNRTLSEQALRLAGEPALGNPAGGLRRIRRSEILASSGYVGAGSAIDLSAFFSSRHSVRQFDSRPVEEGLIVEAVRRAMEAAPSVCNRQGGRVYMMTSEAGKKAALSLQNGNRGWGHEAAVVLVLAASQEHYVLMREERYQAWIDGGMFSQAVLMGLHSVGLAACPLNWDVLPAQDMRMRREVGIPGTDSILMLVAVGHYPKELVVAASPRKPLADVLFHESAFFSQNTKMAVLPTTPSAAASASKAPAQLSLQASLGKLRMKRRARTSLCNGTIHIVPPTDIKFHDASIGDRAVVHSAYQRLRRHCPLSRIECRECGEANLPLPGLVQQSLLPVRRWWTQPKTIGKMLEGVGSIWIIGTDVIDGRYGNAFQVDIVNTMPHAVAAGIPIALISFSYDVKLNEAMRGLPTQACVRPRSIKGCNRFDDNPGKRPVEAAGQGAKLIPVLGNAKEGGGGLTAAGTFVRNSMDIALIMQPEKPVAGAMLESLRWVQSEKRAGHTVLATNLFLYGGTEVKPGGRTELPFASDAPPRGFKEHALHFANELCEATKGASSPLSFLLVPHDFRPHRTMPEYADEVAYLRDVARMMSAQCGARVHILNDGGVYEPTNSAFILSKVDGTVSGLMHLLIISASVGTPGLALVSQAKFVTFQRGIYPDNTYEGSDNCVHNFASANVLAPAVRLFVQQLDRHRRELGARLPHIKLLAERNFDMLKVGGCTAGVQCAYMSNK